MLEKKSTICLDADLSCCSGDNFVVWKKEICSLVIEHPGDIPETRTEFKRLEFQEIIDDETVMLDWLEPVIFNNEPALVLHCHLLKEETV